MSMVTYDTFPPTIIFWGALCFLRILRNQTNVTINSSSYFFMNHGLELTWLTAKIYYIIFFEILQNVFFIIVFVNCHSITINGKRWCAEFSKL